MLNIITALKHGNNWWEMGGGKLGMLIALRNTSIAKKFNYPSKRDSGQHVDTLPQALWHDLEWLFYLKRIIHD